MKKIICLFAVFLGLFSPTGQAQSAAVEPIRWVTAEFPPFIWLQQNVPQGYAYELITAMSNQLGRQPALTFYPWSRVVKMSKEGKSYGLFPLARTPDRETSFKWLVPLSKVNYSFFGHHTGKISIEKASLEQLRGMRIGILRGSSLEKDLQARNFRHIQYEKNYQDLLKMLSLGGIDAIYAGYPMLISAIEEYGFRLEDFHTGVTLGSAELYLASSLGLHEQEEKAWKTAYETLLKDGTVIKLKNKYFSWE
ncbi:substrate-binding periplasmic protein [Undibacterium sp. Ji50W]|uniref:substrate-binding periplasmic protein n=1 Tax=Undibacterium sp. Ji50W TaxID=3413041 RepID=UPI003BF307A7